MRVLFVEDDRSIAHFVQKGLRENYFAVDVLMMAVGTGNKKGAILGAYVAWEIWIGTTLLTDLLPYTLKARSP